MFLKMISCAYTVECAGKNKSAICFLSVLLK